MGLIPVYNADCLLCGSDSRDVSDFSTISSLATGAGTLVLAVATFASVRSANRAARISELALQEQRLATEEQRRPLIVQSRLDDPQQKIMFRDRHWVRASGSGAVVEHLEDNVYLAMSLRNAGAGIAVLQAWHVRAGQPSARDDHWPEDDFHSQTRDLYIPPGDIGLWQGALRDPADGLQAQIAGAVREREPITVELLYTDQAGGQRTISRFIVTPVDGEGHDDRPWLTQVNRHWSLDRSGPR
jgi:hypothetical protein